MKKVIEKINEFEKNGIKDVQLIALVSETSAEVVFYGIIDGVRYQSNNMVEEGKIESDVIDGFYNEIVELVRGDKQFDSEKMNIIKADSDRCKVAYDEKKCKTYRIIKEWEKNLL